MSKTLAFTLIVLALGGVGMLLASNAGAGGTDSCCPGTCPAQSRACCPGEKGPAGPAPQAAAGTVNDRCPIMGGKIDPANVPDALTREFKGQKVGFCCGGCPAAWDKLSDAQKQAKLDKVKIGN